MSRAKTPAATDLGLALLESLAAAEHDGREQLEALLTQLRGNAAARGASVRAHRLAESTQKAILVANALRATGADANAALQAAAQLIAAEIAAPYEPAAETDTDRVVDALEAIRDAVADR